MRCICVFLMALSALARASVLDVPAQYPTIQSAIVAAMDGDTVRVAPGTYAERIDFLGKAITVESSGGADVTIIDGGATGSVVTLASGEDDRSFLQGFTIQNGAGTPYPDFWDQLVGGGIFCDGASPRLLDNVVRGNDGDEGSGIFCGKGAAPAIRGNTIASNGGHSAVFVLESSPTIIDNVVSGILGHWGTRGIMCWSSRVLIARNLICDNSSYWGAGVGCMASSTLTIEDNYFTRNWDDEDGGAAIGLQGSESVVRRNLIVGNWSATGVVDADGARIEENTIARNWGYGLIGGRVITRNVISGNTFQAMRVDRSAEVSFNVITENDAGVQVDTSSPVLIHGNYIARNRGVGIWNWDDLDVVISSNTVVANTQGGIALDGVSRPVIVDNTISLNSNAYYPGGGLICIRAIAPVIRGNIIWDNSAPSDPEIHLDPPGASVTYCDVKGGWPGTGNIDADPLFRNSAADDFTLSSGSPCIDAGDPADLACGRDGDRAPRRIDGDLDHTMRIDMGAHEYRNVHLEVGGSPTPGGTITVQTTGTTGLDVVLLIGSAPAEACLPPFGTLLVDPAPWLFALAWGTIPSTLQVTIPPFVPTPLPVVVQPIARDPVTGAGNTGNAVELTID